MTNIYPISGRQDESEQSGGAARPRPPQNPAVGSTAGHGEKAGVRFSLVPLDAIRPNPHQTREILSDLELEDLSRSIEVHGIVQPVLLRSLPSEGPAEYELVAGERRMRAARLAGLKEIPALIEDFDNRTAAEISVIENAQRQDLNPVEEALAYQQLAERYRMTHQEIARAIGRSRAFVSNALRLLTLEPHVLELLKTGELSPGHARLLLGIDDPERQWALAKKVVQAGLSVRGLERLLERDEEAQETENEDSASMKAALERQEARVREYLNLEGVQLRLDSHGRRRLNVVFETEASWKRFLSKIR